MQDVITLAVFTLFSVFYMHEGMAPSQLPGFVLIGCGAALVFLRPW